MDKPRDAAGNPIEPAEPAKWEVMAPVPLAALAPFPAFTPLLPMAAFNPFAALAAFAPLGQQSGPQAGNEQSRFSQLSVVISSSAEGTRINASRTRYVDGQLSTDQFSADLQAQALENIIRGMQQQMLEQSFGLLGRWWQAMGLLGR
ncbi:MAG: hypothetical protein JWP36_2856 [Paucimonas sp.]|nr:hypothetical protein [Paucimonas sp.]